MKKTPSHVFRQHHVLYWLLLALVVWLTVPAGDARQQPLPFVILLILAPPVYSSFFIYDYFFPRRQYIAAGLLTVACVLFFSWTTQLFFMPMFVDEQENTLVQSLINVGLFTFLALGLRSLKQNLWKQYQIQEARNRQLEAELALLRSQLNPHFLFNTLNNICALALGTPAEQPMFQLSELMRYLVEGSKHEWTELSRELRFLENYIALEQLRLPESCSITLQTEGQLAGKKIAFFILVPFVENIFKHGLNRQALGGRANVYVRVEADTLFFNCWNDITSNPLKEQAMHTGTGLENVRKRLELLYPDRHQVDITQHDHRFEVNLQLSL